MRRVWPVGCALLLATVSTSAAADDASPPDAEEEEEERDPALAEKALAATEPLPPPPPPEPEPERPPTRVPYGGQIVVTDLVALLLAIGGAAGQSAPILYLSLATYAVGPPVIHAAHGNPGTALGSLGLRIGVPVTAAYLGCAAETRCFGGALLGLVGGYLTVVILDPAALAYEDHKPKTAARVMPYTAWLGHGGLLGVQGLF